MGSTTLGSARKHYQSAPKPDRASDSAAFLCFNTGTERYGVMLSEVLEIELLEHFCPVPKSPAFIRGVIQWRGAILTLLDLSSLFSIPQTGIADLRTSVIVEAAGRQVAIAAGEIEDILIIAAADIKVAPELSGGLPLAWLVGVHDNNRMLIQMKHILSDERMVGWREAGE